MRMDWSHIVHTKTERAETLVVMSAAAESEGINRYCGELCMSGSEEEVAIIEAFLIAIGRIKLNS